MPRPEWSRRGSPAAHEARDSRARRRCSGWCVRSGRAREDAGSRGRGGSAGSRRALERRSSGRRRSGCQSRRSSASAARRSPTPARGAPRGDARAAAGPARSSGVSLESPQPFLGHGGVDMDWPHGTRGRTKRLLLRMRSSIAVLWSTSRIYSAEQILQKYGPNPAAIIAVATRTNAFINGLGATAAAGAVVADPPLLDRPRLQIAVLPRRSSRARYGGSFGP